MNLIKQIIIDAKKPMVGTKQMTPNIPVIEIEECQSLFIDERIFEYNMIHRAREAEIILHEILTNEGKCSKSVSLRIDNLLAKFKIKSTHTKHKENGVPKIEISDCDEKNESKKRNEGDENGMDYEKLFQQATQAKIYLEQLLNSHCECTEEDEPMPEEETEELCKDKKSYRLNRAGSPSKRINYKGEAYTLEQSICRHKKRRITLEFSGFGSGKLHGTNFVDGIEGKYICKEL